MNSFIRNKLYKKQEEKAVEKTTTKKVAQVFYARWLLFQHKSKQQELAVYVAIHLYKNLLISETICFEFSTSTAKTMQLWLCMPHNIWNRSFSVYCVLMSSCFCTLSRERMKMGELRLLITDSLDISSFQQCLWNCIILANFFFPSKGTDYQRVLFSQHYFVHTAVSILNSALPCFWHAIYFSMKWK